MNPIKALTRTAGLMLCTAVFAGAALAGDKPKDDAPGNSGNAPGQQKKADQAPPVPAAAPAPTPQAAPPAAEKQADKQVEKDQRTEQKEEKAAAKAAAKAERKQARPLPNAGASAEKKAEKREKAKKPEKAEKPEKSGTAEVPAKAEPRSKGSGSYKATSSGTDLKKGMSHKHTICHATGSATNPYVVITPSVSGVFHGHLAHQDGRDIVPPFVYRGQSYSLNWDAEGQALFANGCRAAVSAPATTTAPTTVATTTTAAAACPPVTKTITEIVVGGVFHKTGNGYVFIRPSKASAHYDESKHADDIVVPDQSLTRTVEAPGKCDTSGGGTTTTVQQVTTTVTVAGATVTLPGSTTTLPGSTVTIPGQTVTVGGSATVTKDEDEDETGENEAAGVLGEQVPPAAAQENASAGGVLGAASSLGRTATTGTLPFTGLPLWLVALFGGGLLATGFGLRHAGRL